MPPLSCYDAIQSFQKGRITLQDLRDLDQVFDSCESVELNTIRAFLELKNTEDFDSDAWSHYQAALIQGEGLTARIERRLAEFKIQVAESGLPHANPILSDLRLFLGGGLSRASTPNAAPEMPTDGWLQGGGVYAFGSEVFRARLGLLATWSGNEEIGGLGLGFFVGDELRIPSWDLMTHVDVIPAEFIIHPKISGNSLSSVPMQMGIVWGVMYERFHPVHVGTSVGFLMQDNERIDKDMAWLGINVAYAVSGR